MNVIDVGIDEITEYDNNPRDNEKAVEPLARSIQQFGFKQPLVIDRDGVIVVGHTRYKAAIRLGYETVPCVIADDLTDEQVKAFRIADNKTGELAEWDFGKLETELSALAETDIDMKEFGYGDFELEMLTEDLSPEKFDPDEISFYAENEEKFLKKKRVIITYDDETEGMVKELLHCDLNHVTYSIEDLVNERD